MTDLFNAMTPLHHRTPGAVADALLAAAAGQARVELVADGVHLSDEIVAMVFALLGPDRIALVTDASAAAGLPDGIHRVRAPTGPREGLAVRLAGGDGAGPLAGGATTLLDLARRCVQEAGVPLVDAVRAATATPAAALGMQDEVGVLQEGAREDLLVVDLAIRPLRGMRRGRWIDLDHHDHHR